MNQRILQSPPAKKSIPHLLLNAILDANQRGRPLLIEDAQGDVYRHFAPMFSGWLKFQYGGRIPEDRRDIIVGRVLGWLLDWPAHYQSASHAINSSWAKLKWLAQDDLNRKTNRILGSAACEPMEEDDSDPLLSLPANPDFCLSEDCLAQAILTISHWVHWRVLPLLTSGDRRILSVILPHWASMGFEGSARELFAIARDELSGVTEEALKSALKRFRNTAKQVIKITPPDLA